MIAQGPEYAEQLTDAERRVLDTLLAGLDSRPASPRRSWRAPVAAGVLSLLIVLVAASVPLLRATAPPAPAAGTTVPSATGGVLAELAAAAEQVPDASAPAEQWYRHRLDVRVSMGGDEPGSCRVTAVTTELWEGADTDKLDLLTGRLLAGRTDPPAGAAALAGCTVPEPDPPSPLRERASEHPGVDWGEMVTELGWSETVGHGDDKWILQWPAYTDPRLPARYVNGVASADRVDAALREFAEVQPVPSGSEASLWWRAFSDLLTSPVPGAATRAATLRAAAAREDVVQVPERSSDVTGRRHGVTLRVPYFSDSTLAEGTADLTFDASTGALLQRVVYTEAGVDVTVYLAMGRR